MTIWQKYLIWINAALLLFFAGVVIGAWLASKPLEPAGEWTAPKQDRRISGQPTKTIKPPAGVVVYDPHTKEKLDLPDQVKQDPAKHVTTAVIIQSDERPQSVVTLLDSTTGQSSALTQRMEYQLLATEQRGQLWLGYGIKNGSDQVGRILLREDLMQVKAVHVGINATLDTDGARFAGVGLAWRW